MKNRYILVAFSVVLLPFLPSRPVKAEALSPVPAVLIAALQTGQEGAAGNDFVVLHNATNGAIDVTGWKLQYRAASATGSTGWTTKRTIACVLPAVEACAIQLSPRTNMVLSTYDLLGVERQPITSGFGDAGGQVRLTRPSAVAGQFDVVDMVGYGNAAEGEGTAAPAPQAGQVIARKQTVLLELIDTNNNSADFTTGCYTMAISEVPAAVSCGVPDAEEPDDETPQVPITPPNSSDPEPPVIYASLLITELLPDPESPATDSADEFIELHNPGSQPVHAKDYVLQTGNDFRYQYSLSDIIIPAGGYIAIFSAESHLSLTNSGTAVRLVDPGGVIIDTITSYGQAKSGQSWAKGANGWQWTLNSTPGMPNVMQTEAPKAVLAAAAAIKKAAAPKKASATIPKTPKTTVPKVAKTTAATNSGAQAASTKPQDGGTIQYWILGGIGALILGYAIYEYRQDIARFMHRAWARIHSHKKSSVATNASTQQTD